MIVAGNIYYYHNDHLGTPLLLTDDNQAVVWSADYMPFGKAIILTTTIENNLRFPGQYYDEETDLHYNYHRYYDPQTGRYLRPDPIGLAGGINLYLYAQNDPVNAVDPWGLAGVAIDFGGAYATGWGGPVDPNSPIYRGGGAGTGVYLGADGVPGYAEIGGFTYQSFMDNSGDTPGAAIGAGVNLTLYFIDADKFFPGKMKYKTWNFFGVSGTIYFDPCSGDATGVSIGILGKGMGWQWGATGVSNGIQGKLQ